jgi:hemerythrin
VTYIEWNDDIALGHAEIDKQHKQLFLLAEAVVGTLMNSAGRQPGAPELQALTDFAQEHFAFEEGLMRSVAYPEADRHGKNHALLMTELSSYCLSVQDGHHTKPAGLTAFLWNWIARHITSEDRDLVVWVRSHDPMVADTPRSID